MQKKMTLEELLDEEKKLENVIRIQHQNLRVLQDTQKKLTEKSRQARLQRRGQLLEKYIGSENLTDQQLDRLLKILFHPSDVYDLIQRIKHSSESD